MIPETVGGTFEDIFKDDLLDEGTYHFRINNIRKQKGKAVETTEPAPLPGSPDEEFYLNLDFVVTGNHEKGLGRHVFQNVPLKPGQMWLLRNILQVTNVQPEKGMEMSEDNLKSTFMGLEFYGVYSHYTTQKNEKRGRITRVMKLV